jgi:nucleoside recognition membrane protein YjiH
LTNLGTLTAEPYVNGTYTTRSAIILSPGVDPSSNGFVIVKTGANTSSVDETGLNIVWSTPYTGNATNFVKWFLRLTWGR